ncbi:MAG: class I SAM-dependent methyltransferase [Moorea sp. SIO3I7]|nr:class I SAM-dependent methyltransferase [Moorena sp. SIO3I7]
MSYFTDSRLRQHPLGFWELVDKPSPDELKEYYYKKYYQDAKGSYEHEYSSDELDYFKAKLSQRWGMIQRIRGDDFSGCILDVGCGEGFTLAFFRDLGGKVKGIDFSSYGLHSQNPSCADSLVTGDIFQLLEDEISSGNKYEIVWLQNVLEHVIDPLGLLESLRALVAPKGITVVTVPNDFSIVQKKALEKHYIDRKFWVVPPDNLSYFDYDSLLKTVNATGWKCVDIIGDFPIDWFLFHPFANYVNDKNVGKADHQTRVEL